jgi:hypothetical protein
MKDFSSPGMDAKGESYAWGSGRLQFERKKA